MKNKYFVLAVIFVAIYVLFFPLKTFAVSKLVIDEFQIGKAGASNEEYITIGNYGDEPLKLDGFVILKKISSGTVSPIYTFSKTANYYISPKQRIVISHRDYSGWRDFYYSSSYLSINYSLYLKNSSGDLVDLVGYGKCLESEGEPIASVLSDEVWKRRDGVDSDDNARDFHNVNASGENQLDVNLSHMIISEILPAPVDSVEWFEVFNPTNRPVNLYGLKVCDTAGSTHCYSFSETEILGAGEFKSFDSTVTKITLNNSGDSLELLDLDDGLVFASDFYEDASKGESFSLFGSIWKWTKSPTKSGSNSYVNDEEIDEDKVTSTTKKSTKKAATKSSEKKETNQNSQNEEEMEAEVKGEQKTNEASTDLNPGRIGKKEIGYGLILLAILLICGYTLFENKERLSEIYLKFSRRNK